MARTIHLQQVSSLVDNTNHDRLHEEDADGLEQALNGVGYCKPKYIVCQDPGHSCQASKPILETRMREGNSRPRVGGRIIKPFERVGWWCAIVLTEDGLVMVMVVLQDVEF
jgi:hypothetical protein